jgi:hypothetical protein
MRAELAKLQKEYLIDMEDVVVVTKDDAGKVKLHQAVSLTAMGAVGGGFWGMLIGMLFLNPLLGAAVGAGAGALSGKLSDIGVNDEFMKELAKQLQARLLGRVRPGAQGHPRQGAGGAEALPRQGQGAADLADQGRGERTAQGHRGREGA